MGVGEEGRKQALLTGASGFVGRRLAPVLEALGLQVRCVTRDASRARRAWPRHGWFEADLSRVDQVQRALDGCQVAFYLIHSLADDSSTLVERERRIAERFANAADRAGVERIVYLGATAPQGPPSEHLQSRLEVGRVLRSGRVPTLELRAGMIVGYGSASWQIVRDLAARLPAMVLPRWLRTRSEPVAVDDVIVALASGVQVPLSGSQWYDLPGPQVMTYRETILRTARLLGHTRVIAVDVPVLSPMLSSHWIRLVTMANYAVARELVQGLTHDLLARSDRYWQLTAQPPLLTFDRAARRALAEEAQARQFGVPIRALEKLVDLVAGAR
ncbi:MAG: NAD(P)H-binding protein [Chloroflexi bacterium]|nr:NAD(P)H-binding protein [Chloroflexota bacterium]